jgi:hypothetical protein
MRNVSSAELPECLVAGPQATPLCNTDIVYYTSKGDDIPIKFTNNSHNTVKYKLLALLND